MDRNKIDRLDASSSTDIAKYAPAACIARGHLENKIFLRIALPGFRWWRPKTTRISF